MQVKWWIYHFIFKRNYFTSFISLAAATAAAKSLQSCLTLCDPIDGSPPGSAVPGILQARTLEWVAISFSNAWKWKVKGKSLSRVRLFTTPWTAAYQAPLSMGFSRQEDWSGVPLPSPWKCGVQGICILVLGERHRSMKLLASRRHCGSVVSRVCWEGLRVTLERAV